MDRQFFADIAGGIGGLVGGDQHRTAALAKLLLEGDFSGAASQAGDNAQSSLNKTLAALLSNDPKQVAEYAPNLLGITAFHGTPHKFDKFSMDKIGTGEGAQAFGHGLYFAENPNVAKTYQKKLGGARLLYKTEIPDPPEVLDWDRPLIENPELLKKFEGGLIDEDLFEDIAEKYDFAPDWGEMNGRDIYNILIEAASRDRLVGNGPGVDSALYEGNLSKAVSAFLRNENIPGLRYKDGMSRRKEGGTHNYVIWDENRIGTPQAVE